MSVCMWEGTIFAAMAEIEDGILRFSGEKSISSSKFLWGLNYTLGLSETLKMRKSP